MSSFPKGSTVIIQGLKNAHEYNGRRAKVVSSASQDGRIMVDLGGRTQIKCKPENLILVVDKKTVSKEDEDSDEIPDLVASSDDDSVEDNPAISSKPQPSKKPVSNRLDPNSSQSKMPAKNVAAASQPVSRKINKSSSALDDDGDEPPDLVSSSDDEEDATVKTSVKQPVPPKVAPPKAAPPKAAPPKAAPPKAAPPHPAAQQAVPPTRPVAPPPADQKRELQQFISRVTEEGRCAFMRAEYEQSFRKYNEIVMRLEKLSDVERRENQRHFARSYTWIAESHLQRGLYDLAIANGQRAMNVSVIAPDLEDHEIQMQARLCCALASKGQGDYRVACTKLQECETLMKQRFGQSEHGLIRKARLARVWCAQYINLPCGPKVILERTDKKENANRPGTLMRVSSKLVIALNNGTDQVVNVGDFREIHDSGSGQGRQSHGRDSFESIVDGMSVVVGGLDTAPDFGMEGIVVNVEENKEVDGGKMCLVMLNEDSTRMVLIPIASLLIGQAAKEAVARRAAWRAFEDKVTPGTAELLDVVHRHRRNGLGARRILAELRTSHPNWEVSEKRIKRCLKDLESYSDPGESNGEGAKASAPPNEGDSGAAADAEDELTEGIPDSVEEFLPKLGTVRQYLWELLQCPICWNPFYTVKPMILTGCGHTYCSRCIADLDKKRCAALKEIQKNKDAKVEWPTCPTCARELSVDQDKDASELPSCANKNYIVEHLNDALKFHTKLGKFAS